MGSVTDRPWTYGYLLFPAEPPYTQWLQQFPENEDGNRRPDAYNVFLHTGKTPTKIDMGEITDPDGSKRRDIRPKPGDTRFVVFVAFQQLSDLGTLPNHAAFVPLAEIQEEFKVGMIPHMEPSRVHGPPLGRRQRSHK